MFYCVVCTKMIWNNFFMFNIQKFKNQFHNWCSQIRFSINNDFFKCFIIFVYVNNYEIRQNFDDDVWNRSSNESFDIIIDANNYSSIVFNCCKQRIDEIQISFFEKLIAIKLNFIEMHNVSLDVFEFNCQLIFKTMSNEMFYIFFHIKSSFFDTNDIEHRFIKTIIVRFVNRIEKINTRLKFRVKNSDI